MSQNSLKWLVNNHVILSKIYNWDAAGLAEHMIETNNLLNISDLPLIHTLWDFQDMATYPTSINDIRTAIKPLFANERLGWVVVISDSAMISFLSQVGSSMYRVRYNRVKTMEEAIEYLQERDPTLSTTL